MKEEGSEETGERGETRGENAERREERGEEERVGRQEKINKRKESDVLSGSLVFVFFLNLECTFTSGTTRRKFLLNSRPPRGSTFIGSGIMYHFS